MSNRPNRILAILILLNPGVVIGLYMLIVAAPTAAIGWIYDQLGFPEQFKGVVMLVTFVAAIFGVYRLYSAYQEYRWRHKG